MILNTHLINIKLNYLEIPESVRTCRDVHCKDINHKISIDIYVTQILNLVEEQAKEAMPVIEPKSAHQKIPKPGWSKQVKPYRDTAHCGVKSENLNDGCSQNTVLYIMKRSQNIYHYEY